MYLVETCGLSWPTSNEIHVYKRKTPLQSEYGFTPNGGISIRGPPQHGIRIDSSLGCGEAGARTGNSHRTTINAEGIIIQSM